MDNIVLDDITYETTGWNGLAQSNFEKITDYINNKLNHDRIVCLEDTVVCLDNNVVTMEGD